MAAESRLHERVIQPQVEESEIQLSIDGVFDCGKLRKSPRGRWVFYPCSSPYLEATTLRSIANRLIELNGNIGDVTETTKPIERVLQ